MTIGCIWFAYREDELLLRESVRCARRTLGAEAPMTVVDDGFCAVGRETRDFLEENHVAYEKSFWPRGGNLIGKDNLIGQTRSMARMALPCDVLIKIDCDTLLLRSDWVERMEVEVSAVMAGSYKGLHNYPMGHCYAVRSSFLERLAVDCEAYPAWAGCFEDYEIGTRLHRLARGDMDYALRYRSDVRDGFWLCDPWQTTEAVLGGRVLSCGYSFGSLPVDRRDEYKAKQLELMVRINGERVKGEGSPEKD